jgi:hypothetical protein
MPIEPRHARRTVRGLLAAFLLLAAAAQALGADRLELSGVAYEHRWSQAGQHEFTPAGQEDLERWQDMLTLVERPDAADGEGLAAVANGVLANYQRSGVIVRIDSRPATAGQPAEHLVVAMLGGGPLVEAAFARLLLHEGTGLVVVRSRRAYGETAAEEVGRWVQANGMQVEQALMEWQPPPAARITALPQSP